MFIEIVSILKHLIYTWFSLAFSSPHNKKNKRKICNHWNCLSNVFIKLPADGFVKILYHSNCIVYSVRLHLCRNLLFAFITRIQTTYFSHLFFLFSCICNRIQNNSRLHWLCVIYPSLQKSTQNFVEIIFLSHSFSLDWIC